MPASESTANSAARPISRRKFLKISAAAIGATLLTCSGLSYAATRQPAISLPEPASCGEPNQMNGKTLITYATRCGSTAEVAQAISQVFCQKSASVDVRPIKDVTDVSGYQAVIIGSAVRFGQWLPETVKFLEQNRDALNGKTVAFFAVHLMNQGDDETSRKARLAYLDPARKLVSPQAEAFFTGVGDMSKVSFMERIIARAVKSPEGDFRNWQKIRAWAESLAQSGFAGAQA